MNVQLTIFKKQSQKKRRGGGGEGGGGGRKRREAEETRDKDCKDWSLKQYEFEYVTILIG